MSKKYLEWWLLYDLKVPEDRKGNEMTVDELGSRIDKIKSALEDVRDEFVRMRTNPEPTPLLTWESGPLWVGECGGTRYEVRKVGGHYTVFAADTQVSPHFCAEENAIKTALAWLPNLTWTPGPVCTAKFDGEAIEIRDLAYGGYDWILRGEQIITMPGRVGSIDECKANAERWAQEQEAKKRYAACVAALCPVGVMERMEKIIQERKHRCSISCSECPFTIMCEESVL